MFKSLTEVREEKYKNKLVLFDDGDSADVILLYRSINEAALPMNGVHYLKGNSYSGYVSCNKAGCPACAKGVRNQKRIFIPVYNIATEEILFMDRPWNYFFENQLHKEVFDLYPNPSEVVFRISRHGSTGDKETRYSFTVVGKNDVATYEEIMAKFNISFPEYYDIICKDMNNAQMLELLSEAPVAVSDKSGMASVPYTVTPRTIMPSTFMNIPDGSEEDGVAFDSEDDDAPF